MLVFTAYFMIRTYILYRTCCQQPWRSLAKKRPHYSHQDLLDIIVPWNEVFVRSSWRSQHPDRQTSDLPRQLHDQSRKKLFLRLKFQTTRLADRDVFLPLTLHSFSPHIPTSSSHPSLPVLLPSLPPSSILSTFTPIHKDVWDNFPGFRCLNYSV